MSDQDLRAQEEAAELKKLLGELERADKFQRENKLLFWQPISKHWEFLGSHMPKKAIIAGNRCGKTKTMLYELSLHMTGLYPKGWTGRRFKKPPRCWLVGRIWTTIRDTIQADLVGPPNDIGTGFIPKRCISRQPLMKNGHKDIIDTLFVDHVSGGVSTLKFWSGEQEREEFQGAEIDILCEDEELAWEKHSECMMRLAVPMAKGEALYMAAFTPLSGRTQIWHALKSDPNSISVSISMDEVPWLDKETIESLLFGCSEMERRAKRHGIPAVGGGQIFQFNVDDYTCESFKIPVHWPRLGGFDIGRNHPAAAVAIAFDKESGCLYAYQEMRQRGSNAPDIARALRHWHVEFATSWDAFNQTFQRGESTADILKDEGLEIFSAGKNPWSRIEKAKQLIASGRLWIFKDRCPMLVDEMQKYSTDESGEKILKLGEDIVDAFLHAVMHHDKAKVRGQKEHIEPTKHWAPASDVGY